MRALLALIATFVAVSIICSSNIGIAQEPSAPNPRVAERKPQEVADPLSDIRDPRTFPALPAVRLLPAMPRAARPSTGLPFELSDLVLAKIDESPKGPQLVALVDQTRTELKNVTVTRMIQEVRTRTVKVAGADGLEKEVEQNYTVTIPVSENREAPVQVPAGKKPTAFPLDELRIYRLDGTQVAEADARKQLEKMGPIFLLRGFRGEIKAVEGVYLQALNPHCLIVVTEQAP